MLEARSWNAPEAGDASERRVAWLRAAALDRDLTRTLPDDANDGGALRTFVDGLRAEMLDFAAIVEGAADTAALNARQLDDIVATTAEHGAVVERTASAIAEIDRGAAHVAQTADALRERSTTLARSTGDYDRSAAMLLDRLESLLRSIEAAGGFASAMESGSSGIRAFLDRLKRIARQARLLAINAAIEAAHLGEIGRGFTIVAEEVKQLASSTDESASSVATIEKQLRHASGAVESAIRTSSGFVGRIAHEIAAARERSRGTQSQVGELETAIGAVAAISAEQSASLSQIALGVDNVATSARDVAAAAERAARLAIADAVEQLRATVARYRLGVRPHAVRAVDVADLPPALRSAAAELRARVDEDQHELLQLVTRVAVSVARNSYEWRAIADGLAGLGRELDGTTHAIDETSAGATSAAAAAQQMRASLAALREGFSVSIDELRRSLEGVAQVREAVQGAEASVRATTEAAGRATEILELIDAIAGETSLLSLNAAIEAAHAGDAGNGFGIIADEIRTLADTTSEATQQIAALIGELADASGSMTATTGEAVAQTGAIHADASAMHEAVAALRSDLDGTVDQTSEVATIVEQQLAALRDLRDATQLAQRRVASDSVAATDNRRLELAMLGMRAHTLASRRTLGTVAEQIRSLAGMLAPEMDRVFEAAIARGEIVPADLFDTGYVELTGPAIAKLGRLFDVSKVPPAGFVPPKYETRYDRAVEAGFNALIDEHVLQHPAVKAMFAVDLNGYCFGHYRECREDWTGDSKHDLDRNRIKRFFDDELSLRCSRVGLGPAADALPRRTPYETFRAHGCALTRTGERPWAIFTYARDTGVVYNDLSVGLFSGDARVATIRIIYDADVV